MRILTENRSGVVLDDQLNTYTVQEMTPGFIVYDQFLHQLHLPAEKWEYAHKHQGTALIRKYDELEEVDAVLFKGLDYSNLVFPLQLYTYYLLQELLGNMLNYSGLGILRERKERFIFSHTPFDLHKMIVHKFQVNDISRFIIRRAKKKDLMRTQESFFVRLDEKFKTKLLNSLILFQSETGIQVEKSVLVDRVLNPKRIAALNLFSIKQITGA